MVRQQLRREREERKLEMQSVKLCMKKKENKQNKLEMQQQQNNMSKKKRRELAERRRRNNEKWKCTATISSTTHDSKIKSPYEMRDIHMSQQQKV